MTHRPAIRIPEEQEQPIEPAKALRSKEQASDLAGTSSNTEAPKSPSKDAELSVGLGVRRATPEERAALVRFIQAAEPQRNHDDVLDHVGKLVLKYTYTNLRRAVNVRYGGLPNEWRASERLAQGLTLFDCKPGFVERRKQELEKASSM
jgi:hypothetical protein